MISHNDIAELAYYKWLNTKRDAITNWLEAERELQTEKVVTTLEDLLGEDNFTLTDKTKKSGPKSDFENKYKKYTLILKKPYF